MTVAHALALLLGAAIVGCSAGDDDARPSCDDALACGGSGGSGGTAAAGAGELPCDEANPCEVGRACVEGSCDPLCSDALCQQALGSRAECRGGELGFCEELAECGRIVACASDGSVCDSTSDTCFPKSGSCSTVDDCPFMFWSAEQQGLTCKNRFCDYPRPPLVVMADVPTSLEPVAPVPGTTLESATDFHVELDGPDALYVVVVAREPIRRLSQLEGKGIWVASRSGAGSLRWHEGTALPGGGPAPELPAQTPLYLTALRYDAGRLAAASAAIPFALGDGWRHPNEACSDVGIVRGSCSHPDRLQGCSARSRCAVVCASNRDCPTPLTSGECDVPDDTGIRFCIQSK